MMCLGRLATTGACACGRRIRAAAHISWFPATGSYWRRRRTPHARLLAALVARGGKGERGCAVLHRKGTRPRPAKKKMGGLRHHGPRYRFYAAGGRRRGARNSAEARLGSVACTNSTTPHEIDIVLGLLFQATYVRSLASVGPRGEAMTEKRRQGARWVGVDGAKAWTGVRE